MTRCKLEIIFLLLLILSGCSSIRVIPSPQPAPEEIQTPTLPVPTETETLSGTSTPEADYPKGCVDLATTTLDGTGPDGLFVMRDERLNNYFLDPKSNKLSDLGEERNSVAFFAISPNRKFILAGSAETCTNGECRYILRTAEKIIKNSILIPEDWFATRWLDNERVIVVSRLQQNDVKVLNPFSGDQTNVHMDLRNPYTIEAGRFERVAPTSLDASLKRVVFNERDGTLILWNLDAHEVIASLPLADAVSSFDSNLWSLDGRKFVTTSPNAPLWATPPVESLWAANELFTLGVDGNLAQLTNYNHEYQFANVSNPSWSPDNRHIGFWLKVGDANSDPENLRQWLAIIDTSTFETKIYCLSFSIPSLPAFPLVWSPDGEQLIANTRLPNGDVRPTLVNLTDQTQALISSAQGMFVENWVKQ